VYLSVYLCIYLSIYLSFPNFSKSVNETSTEARLAPGSCTVEFKQQTVGQVHHKCTVYRGWNTQPFNCSKQSVCSTILNENAQALFIIRHIESEYGYSQTTRRFGQSKSPAGLSVYKCTEAGINSCITVPSKVCAPRVSMKTSE
jgi:hypothetical protein